MENYQTLWTNYLYLKSKLETYAAITRIQYLFDRLLVVQASDLKSTTRLADILVQISYESGDYDLLNLNIKAIEKKHGQFKAVIQSVVERSMGWLEAIKSSAGLDRWLQLIDTLRSVTEGKVRRAMSL